MNEIEKKLQQLFERHRMLDIEALQQLCQDRSRRSVFRDLKRLGYYCSYSHAGRFYTLKTIAQFNSDGLWEYSVARFSKYGTLRKTTLETIKKSQEGRTHRELEELLGVRLHNTLLDLVRTREIAREKAGRVYLYVSADRQAAAVQLQRRQCMVASTSTMARLPSLSTRIQVFVELIRANALSIDSAAIASGLAERDIEVTAEQIECMMMHYDLKKNAVRTDPLP